MLGGQPNHGWLFCFSLKLHAGRSDFRIYDGSALNDYLLMRWWEPLPVVRPTGVYMYLLDFYCSVIQFYTLLSHYLCFISFHICSRR